MVKVMYHLSMIIFITELFLAVQLVFVNHQLVTHT